MWWLIFLFCASIPAWSYLSIKGLPYAYYGSDTGLGVGAFAQLTRFDNASSNQIWNLYAEVNFTTKTEQTHKLIFKMPLKGINGLPLDLTARFIYENIPMENYFSLGNEQPVNNTLTNFYSFHRITPYLALISEVGLLKTGGKNPYILKGLFSFNAEYYSVSDSPELPLSGTGLLFLENPRGVTGGWVIYPLLGLALDGRDNPYATQRGSYHALSFETSQPAWGSTYAFNRFTMLNTFFIPILPDLVLGERIVWDVLWGDVPFFKTYRYGGLDPRRAIGGRFSVKGIPFYRYSDNVKLFNNLELRWMPLKFRFLGDKWKAGLTLFWDCGRVWEDVQAMNLAGFHHTWGFGLRGHWGEDFVIAADFGFWQGDLSGLYIEVGEIF